MIFAYRAGGACDRSNSCESRGGYRGHSGPTGFSMAHLGASLLSSATCRSHLELRKLHLDEEPTATEERQVAHQKPSVSTKDGEPTLLCHRVVASGPATANQVTILGELYGATR